MTPETAALDLALLPPGWERASLPGRYEAARQALALCCQVDECKKWADAAEALRSYARQAQDRTLEANAQRIRLRAVRRMGELTGLQGEAGNLNAGTRGQIRGRDLSGGPTVDPPEDQRPTLAEAGIGKGLADRARKLASMAQEDFEAAVEASPPPSLSALAERARPSRPVASASRQQPVDPFREDVALILEAAGRLRERAERADPEHAAAWTPMLTNVVANLQATRQVLAEQANGRGVLRFQEGRAARNPDAGDFEMVPLAFASREREGRRHG